MARWLLFVALFVLGLFCGVGRRLEGREKKGRERGLKWGVGVCRVRERGDGEVWRGGKMGCFGCISPLMGRVVRV